jgi:hypothetical protein
MTSEVGTVLVPAPTVKLRLLLRVMVSEPPLGTVISGGCQPAPVCAVPFIAVQVALTEGTGVGASESPQV